ncbi:hypothetical protein [Paenibacillus oryzisoli]|uniref:Uncharacterized protein n=1 Tax=Paenibacillus oryzisoli TaxID=1850517 RepID=A0A198AE96_9BACL|nr:hypothetical protein [Paenibacillus oryzisoli]OAS19268.1 hypothetical protein A8708_26525 [Paenibacillus oryzisoli]
MSEAVIPGGYVMVARQVRKSSLWLSLKCAHRMVMMEILLQAQWQDGDVIRNGEIIPLKRGQVATSYQQLVDDIADKDVTIKIVRTAIDKMERAQFLAKDEAVQKAKKGLLLTIVKYGYFQDSDNYKGRVEGNEEDKARAEQGQSEGRARAINNKGNKEKKPNKAKEEVIKDIYAQNVSLSKIEYEKLIEKYGSEEAVKWAIEKLSNYIFSKEPKYKSHYHVLTGWVYDEFEKKRLTVINGGQAQSKPSSVNKIQELYRQAEEAERREANGGY